MSGCPRPLTAWTGCEVEPFLQQEKNENREEKPFAICSHGWHALLVAVE